MSVIASTPLSVLAPAFVAQRQVGRYFAVFELTAYTYDWFLSISEEHEVLAKSGFNRSNTTYLASRITSLGLLIASALFSMAPISNCQGLMIALWTLSVVSTSSTSFLFLLRVRAVYQNSRIITALFSAFWLMSLVLSILPVNSAASQHIPDTQYCYCANDKYTYSVVQRSTATCFYDTLVFLAISHRLAGNSVTEGTWRDRTRSFFKGEGLYSLSRSILQSGQLYYLATIMFFFVDLVVLVSPWATAGLRYTLVPAYVVFSNIMACHVFRGVALGIIEDPALTTTKFAAALRSALPASMDECQDSPNVA